MITEEQYNKQLQLEEEGINLGIEKFKKEMIEAKQRGGFNDTKVGTIVTYQLMMPFVQGILEYSSLNSKSKVDADVKGVLVKVAPDKLAIIALKVLFKNIITTDKSATDYCYAIGSAVVDDLNLELFKKHKTADDDTKSWKNYVETTIKNKEKQGSSKERTLSVLKMTMNQTDFEQLSLTNEDKIWIGQKLLDIFIKTTGLIKLDVVRISARKTERRLVPTQALIDHINKLEGECEIMNPVMFPMTVPPRKHSLGEQGGFLSNAPSLAVPIVKSTSGRTPKYLDTVEMPEVYKAVNAIQETAWKINHKVLDVLTELVNRGKEIAELDLPAMTELEIPAKPWGQLDDAEWEMYKANKPETVKEWKDKARDVHNKNVTQKSKRVLYRGLISVSEKMREEEELYYCYNLDWRGRIYPVQNGSCPNPQGIDASKALLKFADTVALGESGAYWLSVQGANTFGDDKLPMDERGLWASLHEEDIMAVATDPLSNKWWWEADEPWKFLSFCFDYAGYVESGYSKDYESYTAVALDGSCSGIQHFSALLLDERGSLATNVINGNKDIPADIYGEVAKESNIRIEADVRLGDARAILLQGKVNRSTTKSNVMTTPYGVSRRGMVDQLMTQLDREEFTGTDVSFYEVCKYLADLNYESIGQVVVASREAMNWLVEVTKVMQQADKVFTWIVPSGFKVRQAYYKPTTKRISTFWGGTRVRLNVDSPSPTINHKKVSAGQSPNYIHSLDASHLMMTVLRAVLKKIRAFALIHDSFGTHAGNTQVLADTIREAFVIMYSQDNLELFREEILSQLPEELHELVPTVPSKGNLNLTDILKSTYFFS